MSLTHASGFESGLDQEHSVYTNDKKKNEIWLKSNLIFDFVICCFYSYFIIIIIICVWCYQFLLYFIRYICFVSVCVCVCVFLMWSIKIAKALVYVLHYHKLTFHLLLCGCQNICWINKIFFFVYFSCEGVY